MAFASIGALIAGEAASATLVLGAMAEVGTAMTIVGAVTGEKSLMKVGSVLGLVGGIGGMINGAVGGAASSAASSIDTAATAGDYVNSADAMSDAFTSSGASGAGGFGGEVSSAGGMQGMSNPNDWANYVGDAQKSLGDYVNEFDRMSDNFDSIASPGYKPDVPGQSDSLLNQVQGPQGAQAPSGPADVQPFKGNNPSAFDASGNTQPYVKDTDTYQSVINGGLKQQPAKSFFNQIMDWAKGNQTLANGVLQLGGGMLKGIGERSMFDEKMAQQKSQFQTLYGHANEVAKFSPMGILQTARAT